MITAREKQNSNTLYIVRAEVLQNNTGTHIDQSNAAQSRRVPDEISIPDLVNGVNIYNYDTGITDTYTDADIQFQLRESIEDYEEENERLREKIDKLRSEMKLSHGTILQDKDSARIARELLDMPGYSYTMG